MKFILSSMLALSILCAPSTYAAFASERVIIVTHADNTGLRLSREQIRNLFMGASVGRDLQRSWRLGGAPLVPGDQG